MKQAVSCDVRFSVRFESDVHFREFTCDYLTTNDRRRASHNHSRMGVSHDEITDYSASLVPSM